MTSMIERLQSAPWVAGRTGPPPGGRRALRAVAIGATAVGAFSVGALAVGALAVGALEIGKLRVREAALGRVHIDELDVRTLRVDGRPVTP